MQSIIDYNNTKKTLANFYKDKIEELPNIDEKMMEKKMMDKLNYIYINPTTSNDYPHINKKRFPIYNVDDKIFRNANSNIGLGYYQ